MYCFIHFKKYNATQKMHCIFIIFVIKTIFTIAVDLPSCKYCILHIKPQCKFWHVLLPFYYCKDGFLSIHVFDVVIMLLALISYTELVSCNTGWWVETFPSGTLVSSHTRAVTLIGDSDLPVCTWAWMVVCVFTVLLYMSALRYTGDLSRVCPAFWPLSH